MEILEQIADCVVNMDEENIESLVIDAINMEDIEIEDIYSKGLNHGMRSALSLYDNKQYDVPEIIVCADTLNKGIATLKEHVDVLYESKEKVILAVVEGDTHEIGKNIVKIMLEAAGYEIIDMGVNQSVDAIINRAIKEKAKVIGLSSMMTTTRGEMKKLIDKIDSMNLKERPYIILGGGSVTPNYSKEIKSDGYSPNAPKAIKLIEDLLRSENR